MHERVFGLHETIRANTEPIRDQHGKNSWPTRKQHRPTQVPTQGLHEVGAMCQQAGVGPTRNRCHGKKTRTDHKTNVVRTTYPLSFVAVEKTRLREQRLTRNSNKTHAHGDRETESNARRRNLSFMAVSTWIPHPQQVSEIRYGVILIFRLKNRYGHARIALS